MHRVDSTPRDTAGVAMMAASAVCFGTLGVLGKMAPGAGLGIPALLGLRFGIAAVALWVIAARTGQRLVYPRRHTAGLVAMGLLYVGQATAYFSSLRTLPAAITSVLLYVYPVLVVVLARVTLGEHLSRPRLAALALASVGVVLVVDPTATGHLDPGGVVLGLLSAVVYATYIVAGPRLVGGAPAVVATAYVCTTAGAVFLVAAAVSGGLHTFDLAAWAIVAAIAVVPTLVAATLFLAGLARIGPSRSAILSTLEPASTAAIAWIVLGESLTPRRLAGAAVVLSAAVLVALTGSRERWVDRSHMHWPEGLQEGTPGNSPGLGGSAPRP